ncbi:MAG: maleylacetoacetate isomerase [Pseudomonadota bacterium]
MTATLYDLPRSSASYRVRIACNLKGVSYERVRVDLVKNEQRTPDFLEINPSGLVPVFQDAEGQAHSQSLAIMKYLDATHPSPRLFPEDPMDESAVWELASIIACDIHPLNNLRVLRYLKTKLGADDRARDAWYRHWIKLGFEALEARAQKNAGPYLLGETLTAADVCLVPQMYNARRYETPLSAFPTLRDIDARLQAMEPIAAASPDA